MFMQPQIFRACRSGFVPILIFNFPSYDPWHSHLILVQDNLLSIRRRSEAVLLDASPVRCRRPGICERRNGARPFQRICRYRRRQEQFALHVSPALLRHPQASCSKKP